jgi:hypothetical protein
MAFPTVTLRSTGSESQVDRTAHPVTIPDGVAGELIVVVFSCDGAVDCTASVGWSRAGQRSNGTAVTGAVFTKLSASPTADVLTVTTSTMQQASWVVLRVQDAAQVELASSDGSGTNSDPPLLTSPAGSIEHLWIAARCGDARVVATAAPNNFLNLTTATAQGSGGASTNTAEALAWGPSTDPSAFTSASEQWVCFTLALYTLQVVSDCVASYETLRSVSVDLGAGWAVQTPTVPNGTWFSRLTDGYNTWELYGTAALVAENSLDASYGVQQSATNSLICAWAVSAAVSGSPITWFPRLTAGAATWAGVTLDVGTGTIDGSADTPIPVVLDNVAVYALASSVSNDRTAIYQLMARATNDFAAEYAMDGRVSNDLLVAYEVAPVVVNDYAAEYAVNGIASTVENSYAAAFAIFASVSNDRAAQYAAFSSVYNDRTSDYDTLSAVTSDQAALFEVITVPLSAGNDLFGMYWVTASVQQDRIGAFDVLSAVAQDLTGEWTVWLGAMNDLPAAYQIVTPPVSDLEALYSVINIEAAERIIDVYRYGEAEVSR